MSKEVKNMMVPRLRFPDYKNDGEWDEKSIGEIVISESSSMALNKLELKPSGYPVYGADSIVGFIDDFQQNEKYISIVKDGSGVGRLNMCIDHSSILGTLTCLKSINQKKYDLVWIYYLLNTVDFSVYIKGAGIPHIYFSDFKNENVAVPKPDEQQKIADCLSSLDEIITSETEKLEALKSHKKGLMQQLFPGEGERVPKYRFPEFNKDLEKVKLKDVSSYFNGGSYENDVKEEGKYELITLKSINTNGKLINSKRYIDIEVSTLTKGTLIMILSEQAPGLLGMTAVIPTENKYVLNQRVAEIRPNQKIESYFLSMAINRNQAYFSKHGAGMKVQNISKPNVENYKFLLPEILEQQKIASCLSSIDELITTQTEKIEELKAHKKGLMQGLFPIAIETN
jgi:type I restriction enzyme S subunit